MGDKRGVEMGESRVHGGGGQHPPDVDPDDPEVVGADNEERRLLSRYGVWLMVRSSDMLDDDSTVGQLYLNALHLLS